MGMQTTVSFYLSASYALGMRLVCAWFALGLRLAQSSHIHASIYYHARLWLNMIVGEVLAAFCKHVHMDQFGLRLGCACFALGLRVRISFIGKHGRCCHRNNQFC